MPNLDCRMYEARLPEVDEAVMIQVRRIVDTGVYVALLEYNNIEGLIPQTELSRRRIRSIASLVRIGRQETAIVLRVDHDKGYVDLSKRRVSDQEARTCEDRYNKAKLVHSIMRHVADTVDLDLETIYERVAWPLYRNYGHAFDAFKLIAADPDVILDPLTYHEEETGPDGEQVTKVVPAVTLEVKEALVKDIRRRMISQELKIRADVEMKCFQFDGVLHIKVMFVLVTAYGTPILQEAMRRAEAAGTEDCPVKMKLVAAPLYVLTTQTLDKEQGILVLTNAIKACSEVIEGHGGRLVVKEAPRT
uniref:S1 motif domain-containing protein n=1 Tax=Setaria italica TaxID=4555 RepID=K3ZZA9_SETIT